MPERTNTQRANLALSRRHYNDRPLAKLTDDELVALDELSRSASVFTSRLRAVLGDLGDLASQESGAREYRAEIGVENNA